MNKKNEDAKNLLEKVRECKNIKDDPRITKQEANALDFIGKANWDILKAMSEGIFHKQEFKCYGVTVFLRPLCSLEEKEILLSLFNQGYVTGHPLFTLEYNKYVLAKASSPHPVLKKDEEPTLSLATLDMMPYFMIEALSDEYADFIKCCNICIDDMSESTLKEVVTLLESKPALFKDLPYLHKVQTMNYLIEQNKIIMQQVDKLLTP